MHSKYISCMSTGNLHFIFGLSYNRCFMDFNLKAKVIVVINYARHATGNMYKEKQVDMNCF